MKTEIALLLKTKTTTPRPNRRNVASIGLALPVSGLISSPAIAQSSPNVSWRLASSYPKSLDTLFGGSLYLSQLVSEMTDGRFKIQSFSAGEIVPGLQVADAVGNGTVEMGHTVLNYLIGKNTAFGFGTGVPFGMNTRQTNAWMIEGGGIDLINELLQDIGCYGLPAGNTGANMGGWFRKELRTVDDLKGIKFRIPGMGGPILAKLGVVPQLIAGGDVYPALERGTIDGADWVGPYDDEKLGFQRVAPFYYYAGWWKPNAVIHAIMNRQAWESLPASYRTVLATACARTNEWMVARYDTRNPLALKRLVAAGAQLRGFPPPIMEACFEAAKTYIEEQRAANLKFAKIHDSYKASLADGYLWQQVAELTYDVFMIKKQRGI